MTPPLPKMSLEDRYELLTALSDKAIDMARDQLEDFKKAFVGLDSKAIACSTIAGAIVAILSSVGKSDLIAGLPAAIGNVANMLLMAPIVLAIATIAMATRATRIQELPSPQDTEALAEELDSLQGIISANDFGQEKAYNFTRSRLKYWTRAIREIEEKTKLKAGHVRFCQALLALSVGSLGLILFTAIIVS